MEEQVLRCICLRTQTLQGSWRGEQQAQANRCRLESGQSHAAGRSLKKALKPSRKRELATDLMERFGASMRKACAVIKLSRVVYLYQSHARDSSALVMRMKEITQTRVHYGYRRVHVMLRREGFRDNHKRVYRLYREWSCPRISGTFLFAIKCKVPYELIAHLNVPCPLPAVPKWWNKFC